VTSIWPQLSVRNGREAIAWYIEAFGAVEDYRVGGTDDTPEVVAQLSIGDAVFWVSDESQDDENFSPQSLGGGTTRMALVVDDPRAMMARAIGAGAREVVPAAEEHAWLLGRIEDPYGHHWEVGRPLGDWPRLR
jgi:PhnB protein